METLLQEMGRGRHMSIGMVHTLPLPGTLYHREPFEKIVRRAVQDVKCLEATGFDAVVVENVNDGPFETPITRTQIAALTLICGAVRAAVHIPMGIDSCNDALAGFEIGALTGVSFIRVPYFVDTRVGQYGVVNPNGARAVMLRRKLGLAHIKIFADAQVKHTFGLCAEVPLEEST